MATFTYELSFANIPFVSDVARVIRLGSNIATEQEDENQLPPRKYQPFADLVDELNKMIDDRYLNEFNLDGYNRKTDALARNVGPLPNPRIGDFYYPMGATRWACFRGLATSSQVKEMETATVGGSAALFKMQALPIGPNADSAASYTISTNLRMLPPRPLAELGGAYDGLFLVTLVDERYWWNNVVTYHPTTASTWADVLSTLATALGVTLSYGSIDAVYGTPDPDSQLWVSQENAAVLLDAVCYNLGRVFVRGLDGTYTLRQASEAATRVTTNLTDLQARTAGGDLFYSGTDLTNLLNSRNTAVPAGYDVTFPKYVLEPIPHYFNTRYGVDRPPAWWEDSYGDVNTIHVPIGSGGSYASGLSGYSNNILQTTAKSIYDTEANANLSGTALNQSGCHALALQLAKDRYDWTLGYALDVVFPGIVLWTPDGFHDIIWRYSERSRQASTRVMKTAWNQFPYMFQQTVPLSGSYFASGVGGHSVPLTVFGGGLSGGVSGTPYSGINFGTNVLDFYGPNVAVSGELFSGGLSIAHILISGGGGGGTVSGINSGFIGSYSSGLLTSGVYAAHQVPQVQIARYFVSGGVILPSIASGTNGREVEIMNTSPSPGAGAAPSTITYLNESTLGSAADRISTPDGLPVVQQPQETVKLKYTDNRWKFAERIPAPPYTIAGGGGGPVYGTISSGTFTGTSGIYVDYSTTPPQIMRSGCMPANVWICSGTVVTNNLGSGAVQSGNIASGALGWSHMASGGYVAQSGVQIDYTVGPPVIGYGMSSGQVGSGFIGNGAVLSGSVASGSLTWPHHASGYLATQSGILIDYSVGPPVIGISAVLLTSGGAGTGIGDIGCSVKGAYFSGGGALYSGGAGTPLIWSGAAEWDTDNIYNSSSGTLTIQRSGRYLCNYNVWPAFLSGQTGDLTTRLLVNGTQINTRGAGRVVNFLSGSAGVANLVAQGTGLAELVSGDDITVQFDPNGMSGIGINGGVSYLTVQKLA